MLSKNQVKEVTRLQQKKYRQQSGLFIAEGVKTIKELLKSQWQLEQLYTLESFGLASNLETLITAPELKKISALKTPNQAVAVFRMPTPQPITDTGITVVLDSVRDPGNLGTIIRLCDWFGISYLVCSPETVDCYNPKVIQATMGSITRVSVSYTALDTFLENTTRPIYGAFMDGNSVYAETLMEDAVLVMGNEANGISQAVGSYINNRISIPRFGPIQATESLNVATATAILLSEFKRLT
ncbi:TrmH family RNA methyltransferase [Bizionia sediminis]|uniref:TrmH family RNA methyltransferase n=1 Tax=Bizionia sediminis TaxID=1737064 RepID=A0ABW5KVK3_9FLAO